MKILYCILILIFGLLHSLSAQPSSSLDVVIGSDDKGNWGIQNRDKEWLSAPVYDTIFYLTSAQFDPETYEVARHQTGWYLGRKNRDKKWHLLSQEGQITYVADAILPRQMGDVILVKKKNKWGLVQTNGQVVLPVKCSQITWYEDVLALKDRKGKWRLFDPKNGRLEEQLRLDVVSLLSAPNEPVLLLVESAGQQGILDQHFRTVVEQQYHDLSLDEEDENYVVYKKAAGECGRIHLKTKTIEVGGCTE